MDKRKFVLAFGIILLVTLIVGVSATGSFVNRATSPGFQTYYSQRDIQNYWPALGDAGSCEARQDILLQIAPGGCTPTVVTSNLLAEQNVAVFCQVNALKINPLLDIKEIRNIRFRGDYPDSVASVGFHPAKAALRTGTTLLGSPILDNIGYLVVVLKKNEDESSMPDFVNMTLSAQVEYHSGNILGVGNSEFKLSQTGAEEEPDRQSFWNGRFFIEANEITADEIEISIYSGDSVISTKTIQKGKISKDIYVPGSYCQAALNIAYDGFEADDKRATIQVSDNRGTDLMEVFEGSRFLNGKCRVVSKGIKVNDEGLGSVEIKCGRDNLLLKRLAGKNLANADLNEGATAYREAIDAYEEVVDDFPSDKGPKDSIAIGEQALRSAIKLSQDFQQQGDESRLLGIFVSKYPDSDYYNGAEKKLQELNEFDLSEASQIIDIDGRTRTITLRGLKAPKKDKEATFVVNGYSFDLKVGEAKNILRGKDEKVNVVSASSYVSVKNIGVDSVNVAYKCPNKRGSSSKKFDVGEEIIVCEGVRIKLDSVNVDRVARVRILPKAKGTQTETNLSVGIGIEQRAIKLSPEKAKQMMDNIEADVQKWEGISETLGDVVEGMKTACFATSTILTLKNLLTGFNGQTIARQDVMKEWTPWCSQQVAANQYYSNLDCYNKNSDKINKDVLESTNTVNTIGNRIGTLQVTGGHVTSTDLLGNPSAVNEKTAKRAVADDIKKNYPTAEVELKDGRKIKVADLLTDRNVDEISYFQIRDLYMNLERKKNYDSYSKVGQNRIDNALDIGVTGIQDRLEVAEKGMAAKAASEAELGVPKPTSIGGGSRMEAEILPIASIPPTLKGSFSGVINADYYTQVRFDNSFSVGTGESKKIYSPGFYYIALRKGDKKSYVPVAAVEVIGTKPIGQVIGSGEIAPFSKGGRFGIMTPEDTNKLSYKLLNPEVQYYGRGAIKGRPAVVPIGGSWKGGPWYATTPNDPLGAFEANGNVLRFSVCNVGDDGKVDNGDLCYPININSGAPYYEISGLSKDASKKLINQARKDINDATRNYASGKTHVNIGNERIKIGMPSAGTPTVECQQFMSPGECQLLFNLCDPVICPSSRCDLGGNYPVADVIQTGVVGGVLMCLPNWQEGIVVPVCLTGIQAGIDAYASVLRSHRDCLNESITTGKMVGICDQYTSVHICNLFWKQTAPFIEVGLPAIIGSLAGQGARGGGEYLTVQSSWDAASASANQFTQDYGVNSLNLLRAEAVDAIGDEFCGGFISAQAPTSFTGAIESHSPPQFTAWFSSVTHTTVTLPATAQYKVFYHIYAGKNKGVFYRVYLKNPPADGYYSVPATVEVDSGFINQGSQSSESKDFTAPEGYKELCVDIDGIEKCGFQSVSTSLAVNFITDSYVGEQAKTSDIKTEQECISGSKSALGLLSGQPSQALQPAIYNRGVVRICSPTNPAASTEPGRYQVMGYCGDEKIKCWLDKESVERAVSENNNFTAPGVLKDLEARNIKDLESQGFITSEADGDAEIRKLKDEKEKIEKELNRAKKKSIVDRVVATAGNLFKQMVFNHHKAKVNLISAGARDIYARTFLQGVAKAEPPLTEIGSGDDVLGEAEFEASIGGRDSDLDSKILDDEYYVVDNKYYKIDDGNVYRYVNGVWVEEDVDSNTLRDPSIGTSLTLEEFGEAISS